MKECRICHKWKDESEFYFRKDWDKYRNTCKVCMCEKGKEYRKKNREKLKDASRDYRERNKEKIREYHKGYNKTHKKEIYIIGRNWAKNNPEFRRANQRKADTKRRATLRGNLNHRISVAIQTSLKGNKNGRHWETILDYTLEDLINYLKKTLPKGTTWQDFLNGKLHIDHKIPISAFNYDNYNQLDFKRCWALENLQLLEKTENLKKQDRISGSFQPSLKI